MSELEIEDEEEGVSSRKGLLELVIVVVLALGLALLIQTFLVKPYQIPSGSMKPTLEIGQRILVNRFIYNFTEPKPGDTIVFYPPVGADNPENMCGVPYRENQACSQATADKSDQPFVKRIVAGPGDVVSVEKGLPIVNGETIEPERYNITPCYPSNKPECHLPEPLTIPEGHFFVMGDNRGNSADSRFWGPLPEEWIIGKAFATYWSPDRIGSL